MRKLISQGWLDVYRRYISLIYIRYFRSKISDIFDIFNFYRVFKIFFNVTHCDYVLIFSLCVLLAYDLCPQHFLSDGQLLSDFTSPQLCSVNNKSTSPNMQCTHTHTHILLFGSKFHIILAMYVQMLDICIKNIENIKKKSKISDIFDIFENITIFSNPACVLWDSDSDNKLKTWTLTPGPKLDSNSDSGTYCVTY